MHNLERRRNRLRWLRRRYEAPFARDVMNADHRPRILLLRSFVDDGSELKDQTDVSRFTFEEVMTRTLWTWGPVVAIGRPAEELTHSGAAREYLTNEDWRARVLELVEQSLLVVIIVHKTDGLRWEIAQLGESGSLRKCLFVVPPLAPVEANERWRGLWENSGIQPQALDLPDGTIAFLFSRRGTEIVIRASR
jgi:hypothetical protein